MEISTIKCRIKERNMQKIAILLDREMFPEYDHSYGQNVNADVNILCDSGLFKSIVKRGRVYEDRKQDRIPVVGLFHAGGVLCRDHRFCSIGQAHTCGGRDRDRCGHGLFPFRHGYVLHVGRCREAEDAFQSGQICAGGIARRL